MTDAAKEEIVATGLEAPRPGVLAGNVGKPIFLREVNIHGIAAEAAMGGQTVQMWTRGVMTSDQAVFHRVAPNLIAVIDHSARQMGQYLPLLRASTILLVMKPDNTGELWVDAAAMSVQTRLKKSAPAGMVLFESDIADVTGMWFPLVDIGSKDRIIVVHREGFRFGLLFDFNPDGDLSIENAQRDLGTIHRQLKYAELYTVLANSGTFSKIVAAGWFPFIEIMTGGFAALSAACEAGFPLSSAEDDITKKFTDARLDEMFARWVTKSHFKAREAILQSGLRAYKTGDWVASLKVILTEIEGILADAYFNVTGERTRKIGKLLDFAVDTAIKMAGGRDTLFFPTEFAHYLKTYTYADFDPGSDDQNPSRNAVGHGRAKAEHYTQARALQALLTVDQLAFYT